MTSPLLDLFYQLRDEEGFSLSIEQYNRVNSYLIQNCATDANINDIETLNLNNPQLKRLCQALWVKSLEQKQKFNEAWEQMLQLQQEIDLEINRYKIVNNKNKNQTPINPNQSKSDGERTPISEPTNQPPFPPSSPPQLNTKDSQIGTAIETRKKWTSLPKNNPDYYPIGIEKLQESWEQLHPLPLESPRREWDIKSTVIEAAKQGFFQRVIYKKKQLYRREIVIIIDRSDSMIPFAGFARILLKSWQDATSYYFDNVITEDVLTSKKGWDSQSLNRTLLNYTSESTSCLIFSDAGAARKRYVEERFSETENMIRRLTRRFSRVAWLNPLPYQRWFCTTALDIADLSEDIPNFAMFGLESSDFDRLIPWLKEEAIPARHFQPDFSQPEELYLSDDDFFSPEAQLQLFEQDYDANTYDLATRSAFPLSLSPDLLYYLRHHQDKDQQPPWYAVADILLSGLVRRVNGELYEMSPDIRNILLQKLSKEDLQTLAQQLQTYIQQQIGENSQLPPNLQHQQWLSLAYLQPSQAVDELKQALQQAVENNNRVRLIRLTTLLKNLETALEGYEPLLTVTEPLAAYSRGDLTTVREVLNRPPDDEKNLQLGLIEEIQNISPFKLEPLTITIPTLQFVFTEETVFVDNKGKIIKKQPIKAYYYDEILEQNREEEKEDNSPNIRMIYIPEGQFFMGTPDEEIERLCKKYRRDYFKREQPQHLVKLPPFYLSQTPITQAQWRAIASQDKLKVERDLGLEPSKFKGDT
ncbi:MAG: formylglycine-generating enzyme family protein, partial [Crocosphaera sp.]